MIENPPLLTIRRRFPRPKVTSLSALKGIPTGFIVDALGGSGALAGEIKSLAGPAIILGSALTCSAGPADNLAAFGALSIAHRGDVIVCSTDGFAKASVAGDLLLGMMKNRGVAGFVTDGYVRDIAGLKSVGLPCFAAGLTPNSGARSGPGTVGLPIVVGGVAVDSGDIVLADDNGVVIVPQGRIAHVLEAIPSIEAAESHFTAQVAAGLEIPDFIQAMIDQGLFREVD